MSVISKVRCNVGVVWTGIKGDGRARSAVMLDCQHVRVSLSAVPVVAFQEACQVSRTISFACHRMRTSTLKVVG